MTINKKNYLFISEQKFWVLEFCKRVVVQFILQENEIGIGYCKYPQYFSVKCYLIPVKFKFNVLVFKNVFILIIKKYLNIYYKWYKLFWKRHTVIIFNIFIFKLKRNRNKNPVHFIVVFNLTMYTFYSTYFA